MSVVVCLVAIILASAMIYWLNVLPRTLQLGKTAVNALAALAAPGLSDREKELAARRASVLLFGRGALLLLLSLVAFVPSALWLWLLVVSHRLSVGDITDTLFSFQFARIVVALLFAGWLYRKWMISRT